jgi:hypothetical protein
MATEVERLLEGVADRVVDDRALLAAVISATRATKSSFV